MLFLATLVAAGLLSLVHIFVGKLRFFDRRPRAWKSVAGGVGIAYTFLVLLPKLANAQTVLGRATDLGVHGFLVHHSYLLGLIGLVLYYGMDVAVESILVQPDRRTRRPAVKALVYAHACSVSGYYFLVGYLMSEIRETGEVGFVSLVVFALAMVLHYLSIDHGLRMKYGGLYESLLRWTFVAASMGGWLAAFLTELSYESLALLNSLFAGALIFLTLKEEVPGSSYVRFRPFVFGVIGYSLLLLAIEFLV